MSDYDKLTVIKLREELVKRELPKTGLKAALVQRLVEADAVSRAVAVTPSDPVAEQQLEEVSKPDSAVKDAPAQVEGKDEIKGEEKASIDIGAQQHAAGELELNENGLKEEVDKAPVGETQDAQKDIPLEGEVESEVHSEAIGGVAIFTAPIEDTTGERDPQDEARPGNLTQAANSKDPSPEQQLHTPSQTQLESTQTLEGLSRISTQNSLTGEELFEDSRKRKRRSHSPPPSSIETQKRLKSGDAAPHVELPEDSTMQDATTEDAPQGVPSLDGPSSQKGDSKINGHSNVKSGLKGMDTSLSTNPAINEDVTLTQNGVPKMEVDQASKEQGDAQGSAKSTDSPARTSPTDTRFKNLFTAPSKSDSSPQQKFYSDTEDRVVTPALHPATSALYIRELMRPLKPESVKDHLVAIATPSDTPTDSNVITDFYLDSIRTHCLVSFANVSSASRVRSSLHDRVWPNERDRRPLFVDFVPEEKLKKWIDVEQSAPSGRGQPTKKWEVIYEDEDGEIRAYLQEVGSNPNGHERAPVKPAQPTAAGQGVQGAPSGPRLRASEPQASRPEAETGKGFQALDDLFKSTVAKPKLYYQPVARTETDRRLELLAGARGGGKSDEMRRYTFEDDIIVDKSPEFGHRGRGGYGGRAGGSAGGYRGRGGRGGYRGDGYRAGDGYRR